MLDRRLAVIGHDNTVPIVLKGNTCHKLDVGLVLDQQNIHGSFDKTLSIAVSVAAEYPLGVATETARRNVVRGCAPPTPPFPTAS
jgi:hypothetical protein